MVEGIRTIFNFYLTKFYVLDKTMLILKNLLSAPSKLGCHMDIARCLQQKTRVELCSGKL